MAEDIQTSSLEMAYVLFMDIVGYSRMPTDIQRETLHTLQKSVRNGNEFRKAQEQQRLISLPTGDGMALAFFTDPESCVRCAVETTRALKGQAEIPLRMGIHAGPVYRVADINANQNVAGEGINIAQRVMDCGDAGHILISKSLADVLRQLSGWMGALQDLGEVSVKHGVRVHVFNLLVEGAGNPNQPQKFGKDEKRKAAGTEALANWKVWASVAAAFLIIGGGIAWRMRPVYAYRPKIAILGFTDQQNNAENDWVSLALTQDLTSDLESSEKVTTIPGETVVHMVTDLSLAKEVSYSPATLNRVKAYLDCDYVVYGSFFDIGKEAGGQVQLNVRIQNTKTGETWSLPVESGTELTLRDLSGRVGMGLRTKLGVPNPSVSQAQEMESEIPVSPAAQKAYAKGLASLWKYDLTGAANQFQEAIKTEPTFPLVHAELAEAWTRQGYDDRAKEEAQRAKDLSSRLGRESKLRVEAAFQEMSSQWDEAADTYKALWRAWQERPEYAYRAADVQIRAGKADAALATIADLRKQPGVMANSPIIDLREAEAYEALSKYKEELAAASAAEQKAHSLGARMLEAEALWRVCGSKSSLGDFDGAQSACETGQRIAADLKYILIVARTDADLGIAAMGRGKLADALDLEEKALAIAKSVGSQRDAIGALQNMGIIRAGQGNHLEAVKSYEAALAIAMETRNKDAMLGNYNNLATEFQADGDTKQALLYYGKSLELANETKKTEGQVDARNNLGSLQLLQGQLKEASGNVEEALRLARENHLNDKIPSLLGTLGDIQFDQGNVIGAEKSYEDAVTASTQLGANSVLAATQVSLSKMKFEQGDFAAAEKNAKDAAAEFQKEGSKEEGSGAFAALAEALAEEGKLPEATVALNEAKAAKPADKAILLAFYRADIRFLARSGKKTEASNTLDEALAQARKLGFAGWELRLQLIGSEFGLDHGNGRSERQILRRVEEKAGSEGYPLLQQQAKRLLDKQLLNKKGIG